MKKFLRILTGIVAGSKWASRRFAIFNVYQNTIANHSADTVREDFIKNIRIYGYNIYSWKRAIKTHSDILGGILGTEVESILLGGGMMTELTYIRFWRHILRYISSIYHARSGRFLLCTKILQHSSKKVMNIWKRWA